MSEGPAKRRWFRFGLRTLFVAVTIAGCALGWVIYHRNWASQRRDFLVYLSTGRITPVGTFDFSSDPRPGLPWGLRVIGEQEEYLIWVFREKGESDKAMLARLFQIQKLFPESHLLPYDPDPEWIEE